MKIPYGYDDDESLYSALRGLGQSLVGLVDAVMDGLRIPQIVDWLSKKLNRE